MVRQGDLLFVRCEEIPTDAEVISDGVLARGESTGHTHSLRAGVNLALKAAGLMYVKAMEQAYIDHQEHHTITLPVGDWRVLRQREYTPDGWVQVAD